MSERAELPESFDDRSWGASDPSKGMFHKYVVWKTNSEVQVRLDDATGMIGFYPKEVIEDAFVLRPSKDYHERVALAAYIESVRMYDQALAEDMEQFLDLSMPEEGVKGLKVLPD